MICQVCKDDTNPPDNVQPIKNIGPTCSATVYLCGTCLWDIVNQPQCMAVKITESLGMQGYPPKQAFEFLIEWWSGNYEHSRFGQDIDLRETVEILLGKDCWWEETDGNNAALDDLKDGVKSILDRLKELT